MNEATKAVTVGVLAMLAFAGLKQIAAPEKPPTPDRAPDEGGFRALKQGQNWAEARVNQRRK